jgi:cell division protein FtsQ
MKNNFRRLRKIKKRKKILRNRYLWFSIIGIIISIFLFYFFCFSSFFEVKEIRVEGNDKVNSDEIIFLSNEKLIRNILFFNTKSIFLIDLIKTEEKILNNFPEIAAVSFSKAYPDSLTLFVKEREPVAVFEQNDIYFFLDIEGFIFEKTLNNDNLLLIRSGEIEEEVEIGESLIEENKLNEILTSYRELNELGIKIVFVEIVNYQRFNVKTEEGWDIYFNLEGDVSQQVLNLSLVLKEEISLEKRDILEYVDLRFGNQVFYR